jgi:hypothetical protein
MIFSASLSLVPQVDVTVAHGGGWLTHGMAFRLAQAGSARVAEKLHASAGALLVTSGVLRGGPGALPDFAGAVTIPAGEPVWLRLTALGREAALAVEEGLAATSALDLGPGTPCTLVATLVARDAHGGLPRLSELWERGARQEQGPTLEFLTPTAFVRRNKLELALPVPERVFGALPGRRGLVGRWLQAGGPAVFEGWHAEHIGAVPQTLSGVRAPLGRRGGVQGFVGRCRYAAPPDATILRQLWALALFAELAGVGVKTGIGLGATRVIPKPSASAGGAHAGGGLRR